MKLKQISALLGIFLSIHGFSQISEGGLPLSFKKHSFTEINPLNTGVQIMELVSPNLTQIKIEDANNDAKGAYRVGINLPVNYTPSNSGTWTQLADGTKVWRLKIRSKQALALGLYFSENVQIPAGGKLFAYNTTGKQVLGAYTSATEQFQAMEMVQGEELTLEYNAASWVSELPIIHISEVVYFYRGVEEHVDIYAENPAAKAQSCEVDVACSEGTNWTNQIKSVVHYTFNDGTGTYVCSAATINNTAQDCKPYILTAWHCGERVAGQSISTWIWYWKYQKTSCSPGSANASDPGKGSFTMTGGNVRASSGNGTLLNNPPGSNEVAGSDFYLVELNSQPPSTYQVYYAGWNRANVGGLSGVGIHHPAGSAKKISTYTSPLTSSNFNGGSPNSHWAVVWAATANGHGVTEGGSSGSPIFDQNGRIMGQLSGGGSSCQATGSADVYGKMYSNWDKNGTAANNSLKSWLDPNNSGVTVLNGIAAPCAATPTAPIAQFIGNPTTVSVNGTVQFTDQSSGSPTTWAWSISPATGWSFAAGSTAASQNPQVTFTAVGQYTISLTATNLQGSDQEVKQNYITVTSATGPCSAGSTSCDEFIQRVQLQNIDNQTTCTNYTNYSLTATLTKGQNYSITIIPQLTGGAPGTAYYGDEIAAWIDFNGDFDFSDPGEQIAFISISGSGASLVFPFNVPLTAITGNVKMRVRITYNAVPGGEGPVSPCGTTMFGEVEDYNIVLVGTAGIESNSFASISIYPNPVSNELSVDLTGIAAEDIRIELLDLKGQSLLNSTQTGGQIVSLTTEGIAQGMYLLRISNGTESYSYRVIKNE
jgi:PKD repeat protein